MGPHSASASTVTLTTCLPCANAARMWSTAATGLPVDSTSISMRRSATSACQSSVIHVVPSRIASSIEPAPACPGFQPTRSRLARARSGARSAIPTTWTPGMRGAWARYMEPNLPAPTRAMRIGRPSAARWRSLSWRLMIRGRGLTWKPGAALYRQRGRRSGSSQSWAGRRARFSLAGRGGSTAPATIRRRSIDDPPSRADPPGPADRAGARRAPDALERLLGLEDRLVVQHVDHRAAARIRVLERPGATAWPRGLVDARKQYQPDDGIRGSIDHLRGTGCADPGLHHAHRTRARHRGAGRMGLLGELSRGLGCVVLAAVLHRR